MKQGDCSKWHKFVKLCGELFLSFNRFFFFPMWKIENYSQEFICLWFTAAFYQTQQPLFLDVFKSACSDVVEEAAFCSWITASFLVVYFSPLLQWTKQGCSQKCCVLPSINPVVRKGKMVFGLGLCMICKLYHCLDLSRCCWRSCWGPAQESNLSMWWSGPKLARVLKPALWIWSAARWVVGLMAAVPMLLFISSLLHTLLTKS